MDLSAVDVATVRWLPRVRTVDVVGAGLFAALSLWVWWVARVEGGDAGPLVSLLVGAALLAALGRWATFFHGTGAPALLVVAIVGYAVVTGGAPPPGLGPEGSTEAAGALFAIGTGAASVVVVRSASWWPRLLFGLVALTLALLTWRTGSAVATVLAALVLVSTAALLALPMEERRWVLVWPALVTVLVLFGSVTYAAVPLPDGIPGPAPERIAAWSAGLDAVTESPLYGIGPGHGAVAVADAPATRAWVRHEPLQVAAGTGLVGGLLLLALLWWSLVWVARPGGGPGSVIGGLVITGAIAHACLEPIWHVPAVPLALAALAGTASLRGGDAAWRLEALLERAAPRRETARETDDAAGDDDLEGVTAVDRPAEDESGTTGGAAV